MQRTSALFPRPLLIWMLLARWVWFPNAVCILALLAYCTFQGITAKLMSFLSRPDKILRALPFITNKATWDNEGMVNNATNSYPFVLWRNVTTAEAARHLQGRGRNSHPRGSVQQGLPAVTMSATSGLESAGEAGWVWLPTELHKWYAAWKVRRSKIPLSNQESARGH